MTSWLRARLGVDDHDTQLDVLNEKVIRLTGQVQRLQAQVAVLQAARGVEFTAAQRAATVARLLGEVE